MLNTEDKICTLCYATNTFRSQSNLKTFCCYPKGEVAFTDFGYLVLTLWITCSQLYSQFLDYELWWRLLQKHFLPTYSMFSILYHVLGVLDDTGMYYTPHTFCFGPFSSGVVRVVCARKYIYFLNRFAI
jgi:hypothetical protein